MIKPLENLKSIFEAGLKGVDPDEIILNKVAVKGDILSITHGGNEHTFDLSTFKKIHIVGAGKATARMALAMEGLLRDRITGGVISVKYGHSETLARIKVIEAASLEKNIWAGASM